MYIEFDVRHQTISRTDDFKAAANSKNYLKARFTFSEEWEGLEQTAVFSTNNGKHISVLIVDGECPVPWEVLRGREFFVGVFAGDMITTTVARVPVEAGVNVNATPGVQPTPSAYELLVARVEDALRKGPRIGSNENWWVWDATVGDFVDTGAYSRGLTPRIINNTWWVGDMDTGVEAKGKDGNNIQAITRTAGTGAPGTRDTYAVTLTDGSQTTFEVYNGADGNGAGDMTAIVYDPTGKKQDIFAYAAPAVEHYVKSYSSLARLGIAEGTETIEGIAASLPNNATLQYPVSPANNLSILPSAEEQYGTMLVNRVDSARVSFTYIRKGVRHGAYSGVYGTDQGWSGWNAPVTAKPLGIYDGSTTIAAQVQYWFDQHIRWGIFQAALCSDLPAQTRNWDNGVEFKVLSGYRVEITATALNNQTFKRQYDALTRLYTTDWQREGVTDADGNVVVGNGKGALHSDSVSTIAEHLDNGNRYGFIVYANEGLATRYKVFQDIGGNISQFNLYHTGNLPVEAATAELVD